MNEKIAGRYSGVLEALCTGFSLSNGIGRFWNLGAWQFGHPVRQLPVYLISSSLKEPLDKL